MTAAPSTAPAGSARLTVRGVFRVPLRVLRRPVEHSLHRATYAFDGISATGATVTEAAFTRESGTAGYRMEGVMELDTLSVVTITSGASILEAECARATLHNVIIDSPTVVFSSVGLDEWVVVVEGAGVAEVEEAQLP